MNKSQQKLEQKIIAFLKRQQGTAIKQRRIAKALNISSAGYQHFKLQLRDLADAGKIERRPKNCYCIPMKGQRITGKISFSSRGFAFVTPEEGMDIFIGSYDTGTAFHGDIVRVEKFRKQSGKNPEGKVIEIVERSEAPLFGTLKQKKQGWVAIPEMPAPPVSIVIINQVDKMKSGQIVELTNLVWEHPKFDPRAEIKQILGMPEDPRDDVPILLKMFGIKQDFPAPVIKELKNYKTTANRGDLQNRSDFRNWEIFTIDPESAKDFDDAVSLEILPDGNWKLGVHIADVSHYVKAGSALDREARNRGTSIYLGDTVVPMLPEKISNEICSLQPGVDKLTLSVIMTIDKFGNVIDYRIVPGIIKSVRRFNYREVQEIIDRKDGPYHETLLSMHRLSAILRKKRFEAGSIDFDIPEPIFRIGEDGIPTEIKPSERLDSHKLVEEFMLLANRKVAEWIAVQRKREKLSFVYRVHQAPADDDIEYLYELLQRLGLNYRKPNPVTPNDIRKILLEIENLPFKLFIEQIALRSMSKARYSAQPHQHFGLAFRYYTHFTSPIRRYPDLMVHRLIKLYSKPVSPEDKTYFRRSLPKTAELSTENEIRAMQIERAYIKVKQIRFLAKKAGNWYNGIITGVMEFGFFVEISDYLVEGLVHVRTLEDDYYVFDEQNHTLKGRRSKRTFRLGDRVKVKIASVSVKERLIDLEWGE
ncbi:MAG: ribonuclease R [Candidatus Marinimicrobia bacterium]|nr:ribonuclease R [Candidatus Neomarinimicrobiota bacterium]